MIRLPNGYIIDKNEGGGYVVGIERFDNKNRRFIYQASYCNTIESCINLIYREKEQELVGNMDGTLKDFLRENEKLHNEFKEYLKQALKESL